MSETQRVQEAQAIINNFSVPGILIDHAVLAYEDGTKRTYMLRNVAHLNADVNLVRNLDRNQQGYISDEISRLISEHYEQTFRYSLQPLQTTCNLTHSNTMEGRNFKEFVMVPGWIYNLERLRSPDMIFPDSSTSVKDGKFVYEGNPVKSKITDKVVGTLAKAGLMKKPKKKVCDDCINLENGESSVWSYWGSGGGCFVATAGGPSLRYDLGVVALMRTDKVVEKPKKRRTRNTLPNEDIHRSCYR
jgi:hypothetical protein